MRALPRSRRVYVKVTSDFDATGYMQPKTITWADGRVFQIEAVRDFRPMSAAGTGHVTDCYTVMVRGEEKLLFFERADANFPSRFGRWFVECPEESRP